MTDDERIELEELKAKCLKLDGEPRKDAETEDLERLKELCELEPELAPLDADELDELENLEARANTGRQMSMPSPIEMRRLGELRKRQKANDA